MVKSEVINVKVEDKYPFIGESDYNIVLFTGPNVGTVIACKSCSAYEVGHYNESWSMSNFTPYRGKVILSNDL